MMYVNNDGKDESALMHFPKKKKKNEKKRSLFHKLAAYPKVVPPCTHTYIGKCHLSSYGIQTLPSTILNY